MRQDIDAGQGSKRLDLRAGRNLRQNRWWKHRAQYQHAHAANESELMVLPG